MNNYNRNQATRYSCYLLVFITTLYRAINLLAHMFEPPLFSIVQQYNRL